MPKEIQLARWGNPYSTSFAGGDLIRGLGEAGRGWRAQQLSNQVDQYAEETMYMADQQRRGANELGLDDKPLDRLQQVTDERAGELFAGGIQGLEAAEKEVGERAFRNFKRYKDAVDQGAGNPAAARISIEKEMRDMIRANPGFADVISNAAQQAMTSTEFKLLTRDPDAIEQVNQELTPFQKAQRDIARQADYLAMRYGWDQEQRDGFYNEQVEMYIRVESLGRSLQWADESTKLSDLQVDQYAQGYIVDVSTKVEDIIFSSGILEGDFIPQENIKALMNDFQMERKGVINDFIARTAGKNASTDAIERGVARINAEFDFIISLLEDNSAAHLLETYASVAKNGNYVAMTEFAPIYTMFADVFGGDNAAYMVSSIFNPDNPESQFAFKHSPLLKELRDKAKDMGLNTSKQMEYVADGLVRSSRNYMTRQVLSAFDPEDQQAAATVLRAGTGLEGEKKAEFEKGVGLANIAKMGDPLFAEYILNSSEITKETENILNRVYKPAVENVMNYAHDMARSFEKDGDDAYTLISMDDSGKVSMNVVKRSGENLYVYPVIDEGRGAANSGVAMNALSVYDTQNHGKQSLLSGNTKEIFVGKDMDPRSFINGELLYVNNNKPTPEWIINSKDPKVNGLFRDARRFQEVYKGL